MSLSRLLHLFCKIYVLHHTMGLDWGLPYSRRSIHHRLLYPPRRCDGKTPPPKTSSQSSQPSRGGVSTTDRSVICLLFLLKLVCTFWTTALHLRQQMGSGRSFLFSVMFFPRFPFGFAHTLLNCSFLRHCKFI